MESIEDLRKELIKQAEAGGFSGFGGMFIQALDLEKASDEEILEKAKKAGILK